MSIRTTLVVMAAALVLASCGIIGDGSVTVTSDPGAGTDTTQAPDPTSPDPTQAPDPTLPDTTVPEGEDADTTPWWLLLLVVGGFLILIIALVSRGSKKKVVVTPPPTTWKDNARKGYAEARWLYDAMGEDMAVWRGNAKFDGTADVGASAGTSRSETWVNLNTRMATATDALYALEASAPDTRSAEAASTSVAALRGVRDALDARAESRFAYRSTEAGSPAEGALTDAREREVRSSRNLVEARNSLAAALTNLSTLV